MFMNDVLSQVFKISAYEFDVQITFQRNFSVLLDHFGIIIHQTTDFETDLTRLKKDLQLTCVYKIRLDRCLIMDCPDIIPFVV